MLDPTAERLPSELREMLYSAVNLHLYRGEVVAASARIAARESEAALREEITEESSALQQQKITLADDSTRSTLSLELQELKRTRNEIAEEIQCLQQKL
jgi:hypothetical protein